MATKVSFIIQGYKIGLSRGKASTDVRSEIEKQKRYIAHLEIRGLLNLVAINEAILHGLTEVATELVFQESFLD